MILTPSGTLSELFEDGDAPNQDYIHDRLRIFLTSEMRICCKCSSDRHQQHLCHHVEKSDGSCDEDTCMFECREFQPRKRIFGTEMCRVVNRMPVDGKHCTCVPTFDNFIRDVNNFGNFTEYSILKSIHRQMLEDERRCSGHTDEKSKFA